MLPTHGLVAESSTLPNTSQTTSCKPPPPAATSLWETCSLHDYNEVIPAGWLGTTWAPGAQQGQAHLREPSPAQPRGRNVQNQTKWKTENETGEGSTRWTL